MEDLREEGFVEGVVAFGADLEQRLEEEVVLLHMGSNKICAPALDDLVDACDQLHDCLPWRVCCNLQQLANNGTTTCCISCVVGHAQDSDLEVELHQGTCLVKDAGDKV